jgi:ureidoacrylate peracid hydrolase
MQRASFGVVRPHDCPEDLVTDIPTSSVAVVIIDMQNAFCHPDGSFGQVGADVSGCNAAIAGCVRIVEAARANGYPVVFTRAIHERGLTDWRVLSELPMFAGLRAISSCEDGTWDADLVDELKIAPGDIEFTKSRYSPFVETDIEAKLRGMGIENLVFGGVGTSVCLESSVRDASQRDFRSFVVEDACGDISPDSHQGSLHIMGHMFGWNTNSADVAAAWGAA